MACKLTQIVNETDVIAPEISVIIPAYNSARTIEQCLESLAQQKTTHDFEVIVVHSGADDTCTRVKRRFPQTQTVQLDKPTIPSAARNHGAQRARGKILAFLDSDVYAASDWMNNVVRAAQTKKDLICGSIENANPHSAVSRAEQLLMFNEFLPDAPQRTSWFALSGNMVISRDAYERFGPFVQVRAAEDIVFSRKLIEKGGSILFYPRLKVLHDNRTKVRIFLRNQWFLGKHTMLARRMVNFPDIGSYSSFLPLFVLLLPLSPVAKLAKITLRLIRSNPYNLRRIIREFPLMFLGLCTYCAGMTTSAFVRKPS